MTVVVGSPPFGERELCLCSTAHHRVRVLAFCAEVLTIASINDMVSV